MEFNESVEAVGKAVDAAGVAVTVIGILVATAVSALRLRRAAARDEYRRDRQAIGRAILLGLEVLLAADIIRTVAIAPRFRSAGVLAVIVLIRTFLSFSLEVELEGHWPWRRAPA